MTKARFPSEVAGTPSLFDRFATAASEFVSKAWFFAGCVVLVVVWGPSLLLFPDVNTWQLAINTPTTIITFLLVALLQNTARRTGDAQHHKLNAIAAALAMLLDEGASAQDFARARYELVQAVGLEEVEHS